MSMILDTIPGLVFLPWRILTSSVDAAPCCAMSTDSSRAARDVVGALVALAAKVADAATKDDAALELRDKLAPVGSRKDPAAPKWRPEVVTHAFIPFM